MSGLMIVYVRARYESEPYHVIATESASDVGKLKQTGEQYGYLVEVRHPSTTEAALRFMRGR